MARRPSPPPPPQHASLSDSEIQDGIRKLERRIKELKEYKLDTLEPDDPELAKLEGRVTMVVGQVFGGNTIEDRQFEVRRLATLGTIRMGGGFGAGPSEAQIRHERIGRYCEGFPLAIANLEGAREYLMEQLEDRGLSPGAHAIKSFENYDMHPVVAKRVSKLFIDGHYAEAIVAACKALNHVVQGASGEYDLDGEDLMKKVFSAKKPILGFNDLDNKWDNGEQRGFMDLYAGCIAAFRNQRSHKFIEDDPEFALEVIAFVSFLAKLAERADNVDT